MTKDLFKLLLDVKEKILVKSVSLALEDSILLRQETVFQSNLAACLILDINALSANLIYT